MIAVVRVYYKHVSVRTISDYASISDLEEPRRNNCRFLQGKLINARYNNQNDADRHEGDRLRGAP